MNWFDYLLLAIIAAGAVAGMRLGVIGAAFMAVGGLVGWMLAGRLSDGRGRPSELRRWRHLGHVPVLRSHRGDCR